MTCWTRESGYTGLIQHQVHAPPDDSGTRFVRGMYFALLSLVWIYVVGIHQSQALEPLKDNSSHFIARFAPILYLPTAVAFLFGVMAAACVAYQYYKTFVEPATKDLESGPKDPPQPERLDTIEEEQDLEEIFRKARAERSH